MTSLLLLLFEEAGRNAFPHNVLYTAIFILLFLFLPSPPESQAFGFRAVVVEEEAVFFLTFPAAAPASVPPAAAAPDTGADLGIKV